MRVDLFDFDLPHDRIALRPAEPRESARLLDIDPRRDRVLVDRLVGDLPEVLRKGDLLIANDTRVIKAQLHGVRTRNGIDAKIGVTLHKRLGGDGWAAFVRPAKKLALGETIRFGGTLNACVEALDAGEARLRFDSEGDALDAAIESVGEMPLPPYIASKRKPDERDETDYQTRFASKVGAVAAPTAGLHVTDALREALMAAGVAIETVTLHVGAGTFLPVKADDTDAHRMHAEWGTVSDDVATRIADTREAGGRVVALGTTSLRILESSLDANGRVAAFEGDTDIFLTPGVPIRSVDALLTNFHLPRSTLFMLVAAFSGLETMQSAYRHAIVSGYRFYSYGDACLLANTSHR